MAHYQITASQDGGCYERLVEDRYNSNGNIETVVLGGWQPCQKRHVGISGRSGGGLTGSGKFDFARSKNKLVSPKMMVMSVPEKEIERTNILMISVIIVFVGITLYKTS